MWLRPLGDIAFKLKQRIEALSKKFDTPAFDPHITLLGGLPESEATLTQLTDTLAGSLEPFEVELTKAGYRDTFYQSLFIHVGKNEQLLRARKTAEQLFNYGSDEQYMPHVSLLYGDLTREEKERILNSIGREFHIRFGVHNLMLVDTTGKPADWKYVHSSEFRS